MEVFAPDYYEKFKCIADKCEHTCCVGWDIYIDDATYAKYKTLDNPIREELLSSLEDTPEGIRFRETECGKCPMLDKQGLCRLISAVGEGYLSDICRLHPRFICEKGSRREIGLGLACEEAARLALLSEKYPRLVKIGNTPQPGDNEEYDASKIRDEVVEILSRNIPLSDKIYIIEEKSKITTSFMSDTEWLDFLSRLEVLDDEWTEALRFAKIAISNEKPVNQLSAPSEVIVAKFMIYLASRHIFAAESDSEAKAAVGFTMLGGRILAILISSFNASAEKAVKIARLFSSEIEYCENNTEEIMFEFQMQLL